MRSTELTRDQLERMERDVERHHWYDLKLWRRAQANDVALDDPFVQGICRAWDGVNQLAQTIERLKNRSPQHYRPLAKTTKRSELSERELPCTEKQRRAAAEVEAEQKKPRAPLRVASCRAVRDEARALQSIDSGATRLEPR